MLTLEEWLLAVREPWMRDALCAEYPREWWFPEKGDGPALVKMAKAVCFRCLVRAECLDYAMSDSEARYHGIWGGTGPEQRKRLRRTAA